MAIDWMGTITCSTAKELKDFVWDHIPNHDISIPNKENAILCKKYFQTLYTDIEFSDYPALLLPLQDEACLIALTIMLNESSFNPVNQNGQSGAWGLSQWCSSPRKNDLMAFLQQEQIDFTQTQDSEELEKNIEAQIKFTRMEYPRQSVFRQGIFYEHKKETNEKSYISLRENENDNLSAINLWQKLAYYTQFYEAPDMGYGTACNLLSGICRILANLYEDNSYTIQLTQNKSWAVIKSELSQTQTNRDTVKKMLEHFDVRLIKFDHQEFEPTDKTIDSTPTEEDYETEDLLTPYRDNKVIFQEMGLSQTNNLLKIYANPRNLKKYWALDNDKFNDYVPTVEVIKRWRQDWQTELTPDLTNYASYAYVDEYFMPKKDLPKELFNIVVEVMADEADITKFPVDQNEEE